MRTINANINGYLPLNECDLLPECSGVYFVYTGFYNPLNRRLNLGELIYIGESDNVRKRVCTHEKTDVWKSFLKNSFENLWFSVCPLSETDRKRAEAAYIYHHKPVVNTEYKYDFPFQPTRVVSTGKSLLLDTDFTAG